MTKTWGKVAETPDPEVVVGENGLEYPSRYAPGSGSDEVDDAWEIVDMLGHRLTTTERALTAGMIMGTIFKHRKA